MNNEDKLIAEAKAALGEQGVTFHPTYESPFERIQAAMDVASQYGSIDGEHHKTWVLDQMVRALMGSHYTDWRKRREADDGRWDEGIAP